MSDEQQKPTNQPEDKSGAGPDEDAIIESLRRVHDPEIPVNIYDLGLIYELSIEGGEVTVRMTLTTPNCPVAESMPGMVEQAVKRVEGVTDAHIDLVWEPRWTPAMITEEGRMELEMRGMTVPRTPPTPDPFTSLTTGRRQVDDKNDD